MRSRIHLSAKRTNRIRVQFAKNTRERRPTQAASSNLIIASYRKVDAAERPKMSDAFPVFVGITGKREFSREPETAQVLENKVRERLKVVFDYVDDFLPLTPKILLTGGAAGADLIAAEEVLGLADNRQDGKPRQNWLVAVVLPFEQDLFEKDFTPEQWPKYLRVIRDERTRVSVLPPLLSADGRPVQAADVQRRSDTTEYQKDLRRRHYEQVGLWIADILRQCRTFH
jgi:hypothetical protein